MESLQIVESLASVDPQEWNTLALAGGSNPFVRHEFLSAMIECGCTNAGSGWHPQYIVVKRAGALVAAMPLYVKTHSYGEYVFDWAWADAYDRHGIDYYPKLLSAVPFTPVSGPRLIAATDADRSVLVSAALELAKQTSSLHVLFPTGAEAYLMQQHGMLLRRTVQFHWCNEGDADFDAFLARMNRQRRKIIRQERRRVRDAGVTVRWLRGPDIKRSNWEFFARCYRNTYAAHHSSPYLNLAFFRRVGETMPENTLMFIAERGGVPIAATLNFVDGRTLYGRYWGAVEHVPLLHFECCYYQAIEYAIANGISTFEGGAQGEHKLFRGLLPVETVSAHWLAHPRFARAIEDYLERESLGIAQYVNELSEHSPFK